MLFMLLHVLDVIVNVVIILYVQWVCVQTVRGALITGPTDTVSRSFLILGIINKLTL